MVHGAERFPLSRLSRLGDRARQLIAPTASASTATVVLCASQARVAMPAPSNLTRGSVERFDAAQDYFPDELTAGPSASRRPDRRAVSHPDLVLADLVEIFHPSAATVQPVSLAHLNRRFDLLWLFGRQSEHEAGVSGSLREVTGKSGNRFSRAW